MCGINGVLRLDPAAPPVDRSEIETVRDSMASRGPDGRGLWLSSRGDVGFGHRRLAIIDLSEAGAQPIVSADGRLVLTFNGEIYNYRELRRDLRDEYRFRTQTDSEVILALYLRHGTGLFARLRGMYAFALWDEAERRLLLGRDPYGIKPLYYAVGHGSLRFASQVKALEKGSGISSEVDPTSAAGLLLWGSVPEPRTIRRDVRCVPAGHFIEVSEGHLADPRCHIEWTAGSVSLGAPEAVAESVRAHLVSDVPVGVFLSAGLDSSMICAVACRHLRQRPTTFTLAFDEFRGTPLDEAHGARDIASELGTDHVERRVAREEYAQLWQDHLDAMDQPSIDGFNVFLVSRFAHEAGLKVVLSGLGGDELFGSYPSFIDVPRWRRHARRLAAIPGIGSVWPALSAPLRRSWPKARAFLSASTLTGAYVLRRAVFLPEDLPNLLGPEVAAEALACQPPASLAAGALGTEPLLDDWEAVHRMESALYMRNQLLRDADWASMAHSLELRVPLVDLDLTRAIRAARYEPARSLGKAELVRLVAPELSPGVLLRPKSGFVTLSPSSRPRGPAQLALDSRARALEVARMFGVALRDSASAPGRPRPSGNKMTPRGASRRGTLLLLPEAFRGTGGIQRYNRDQVAAIRRCEPDAPLHIAVLNDNPADLSGSEWAGVAARGFGRSKVRFALWSIGTAARNRPDRILLGHRHFLPLAPLLRLAAIGAESLLLGYGVEVQRPFGILERLLLRAVDRACAISPQTASALRNAGWHGRIALWPCSLPPSWRFEKPTAPAFSSPTRLLLVSRLDEKYKGIPDAILAVRLLADKGIEATLDVVGHGAEGLIRAAIRDLCLGDRVFLHGGVSEKRLHEFYAACDIFVLPSSSEGFGIVYIEAMAHGRPVVGANAAGTPFVVRDGITGFLVPYGAPTALAAQLEELIRDPDRARRVGRSARAFVERTFAFSQMVERTRAILNGTDATTGDEERGRERDCEGAA